jgi:hypothetical protein
MCYRLALKTTRHLLKNQHGAVITEFENPGGYLLKLKHFNDEIELSRYMLTMGELFFANSN